ncbi:MAG TPA: tetratricopeptide repeat protein, partial [Vicinamibacterales bacterium]|nr:tetratricopeptide repeat protein [Vicinamibacterales bacterium]
MGRAVRILPAFLVVLAAASPAAADPSGYLKPEGDAKTVAKAASAFRDGVRLLDAGTAATALAKFRRAASLCPDFFEARYNVAKLEGIEYGRERAVNGLTALCKDFPDNVRAYSDLGQLLVETDAEAAGRAFGTAVANGEKLLKDETLAAAGAATVGQVKVDLAFAYHNRGAWRLARGEYDTAVADLRRSIELNDTNFFSHYGLGLALLQQGAFTEAKAAFKRAKRLKSSFADCSIGLARAYLGETPPQPAAALAELKDAEKGAGQTAQIATLYGDAYELLGRQAADGGRAEDAGKHFAEAQQRYTKALALGADRAAIALKRGIVARDQQDFDAAHKQLQACLAQTTEPPLLARAHRLLGEIAEIQEDYETAAAHYATALEHDPTAQGARLHLGVCLYQTGKTKEAEKHLAAAIEALGQTPPRALAADLELARKLLDKIRS